MGLPLPSEEERPIELWLTPLTSAVPDIDDPKVCPLVGDDDDISVSTLLAVELDGTLPVAVEIPHRRPCALCKCRSSKDTEDCCGCSELMCDVHH